MPGFRVQSVDQVQGIDQAGNLRDQLSIVVTLTDKPGSLTIVVPDEGDIVAEASAAIEAKVGGVYAIYGLG